MLNRIIQYFKNKDAEAKSIIDKVESSLIEKEFKDLYLLISNKKSKVLEIMFCKLEDMDI